MSDSKNPRFDAVARLCPACGMCCNGVLFGDVELWRGDAAGRLAGLGLDLFRKGRKTAFSQPCACFDGKHCRIYGDRPKPCRAFECRLLQRVQAGDMKPAMALRKIGEARDRAEEVRRLLRVFGNHDEGSPLNRRYAAVLAQPIELDGDPAKIEQRGKLLRAVHKLVKRLQNDFIA